MSIRRYSNDENGSISVMSVATFLATAAFLAIAVDIGSFFYHKRKLQSATDLAAIAGASDLPNAAKAVQATLNRNGYSRANLQSVEVGMYVADSSIPPSARFTPITNGTGNAVRVTSVEQPSFTFGRIFNVMQAHAESPAVNDAGTVLGVPLTASAVASQASFASFTVGSRLLNVNASILNSVLGALLETTISLTAMDYNSLLSTNVDLFSFSNALATRLNLTAGTYSGLLAANVRTNDVLNAMIDALRSSGGGSAASVLNQIISSRSAAFGTIKIGQAIDLGPYDSFGVGQSSAISAKMTTFDLLWAIAQLGNGEHQVQIVLNTGLPGIASASLQLVSGEKPQSVKIGEIGASAHTAQKRLLLNIQLAGSGSAGVVNLPIYIEVARATAMLTSISCGASNIAQSSVTLGVTPGIVSAWIGAVKSSDMTNFSTTPNPVPAILVNLPVGTVTGRASVSVANLAATPVTFSYSDITAVTKKTTSTTDFTSSLVASLVRNLSLQANVVDSHVESPSGLTQSVSTSLASATSSIDQLLAAVIQSLGVGLGQADTWVSGIRCGTAVLVN